MNSFRFNEVYDQLPLRSPQLREFGRSGFCVVNQPGSDQPTALVREMHHEQDCNRLNQQLEKLQSHGVEVVEHLGFIAADNSLFMASQFIDGPLLDDWAVNQPDELTKPIILEHVRGLGAYFTEQITNDSGHLADIVSPFQYMLHNGRPVLIDLDSSTIDKRSGLLSVEYLLGSFLVDIGMEYGKLLEDGSEQEVYHIMQTLFCNAIHRGSLYVHREPALGLDEKTYDMFR